MTGQYKSKVTCPTCKKESITFDPFITVTLPIPQKKEVNLFDGFFIFNNFKQKTKKISFPYSKANVDDWCKSIGAIVNIKP
jgi:ubiquitin C-terminal hydrolase